MAANLSNYRYNQVGGVDADRTLDSGEVVPYTLSSEEVNKVSGTIGKFDKSAFDNKKAKSLKMATLSTATVEVDGLVFQASELSRSRMLSAIIASDELNETQTVWRMADNSEVIITLAQLKAAHAKAVLLLRPAILNNEE